MLTILILAVVLSGGVLVYTCASRRKPENPSLQMKMLLEEEVARLEGELALDANRSLLGGSVTHFAQVQPEVTARHQHLLAVAKRDLARL